MLKSLIDREEQDFIDRIIGGQETGHYYLIIGEKVSGTDILD